MNRIVIVTGASGFIGRRLVKALVLEGYIVYAMVRCVERAKQIPDLEGSSLFHHEIGMTSLDNFPRGSILFHCAWEGVKNHQSEKHLIETPMAHLNFLQRIVIDSGIKKIIVTGTMMEYGINKNGVYKETLPDPSNPYGVGKNKLHQMLRHFQNDYSFELIWARLFYVYKDDGEDDTVVSQFDRALRNGESVFNMSQGEQICDFLHIDIVCKKLISLIHDSDGVVNICSGIPVSLKDFLESRMKILNKQIKLNLGHYPYRRNEQMSIWGLDPH